MKASRYPAMHPVLQYIIACVVVGVIGVLSACTVFALWWLLGRRTGMRLDLAFLLAAPIGFAGTLAGEALDIRLLAVAPALLWGWVVLPVLVLPPLLLWRLAAWCRRKIAA